MTRFISLAILAFSFQAHAVGTASLGDPLSVHAAGDGAKVQTLSLSASTDGTTDTLQVTTKTVLGTDVWQLDTSEAQALQESVDKARSWVKVAQENKVDVQKPVTCIGDDPTTACAQTGVAIAPGQIGMMFISAGGGAESVLVFSMKSTNDISKSVFMLMPHQMDTLSKLLEKWPEALLQARAQHKATDLFQ